MIRKWFEMKKKEIEAKNVVYSLIIEFGAEHKNVIELLKNIYTSLKDVPVSELRSEFIRQLAIVIHESNNKDSEEE